MLVIFVCLLIYCLIIIGSTYAYLYIYNENANKLTGNLGTANIELSVERVIPNESKPLVPLLDAALSNAIQGNGGKSACIDANNNLSCEVYKITIENTGTVNLVLNTTISLTSKNSSIFQNLKWRELTSPTEIKETSEIKAMAQSILDAGFTINSEETKIYYIAVWLSETGSDQLDTDQGLYGGIVRVTSISGEGVTASFGEIPELATTYIENLYNDGSNLTTVSIGEDVVENVNMSNTKILPSMLNNKIKLIDTTESNATVYLNSEQSIMLDNNDEYRYYGATPNNYVTFNNELWRIINVSNVKSSLNDKNGEMRIKLIRNNSIGSYSWDSSDETINSGKGINDWTQADLMTELNTLYYNKQSGTCYNTWNNGSITCDFSKIGLNDISKTLIDDAVWYLGAGSRDGFANVSYNSERSTTVYTGHPTTWTGKVGIMQCY